MNARTGWVCGWARSGGRSHPGAESVSEKKSSEFMLCRSCWIVCGNGLCRLCWCQTQFSAHYGMPVFALTDTDNIHAYTRS